MEHGAWLSHGGTAPLILKIQHFADVSGSGHTSAAAPSGKKLSVATGQEDTYRPPVPS